MGSGWSNGGRQLYDAARDGNLLKVVALLSNPEGRSFINWQDEVACPPYRPLSLLLHSVAVNILA